MAKVLILATNYGTWGEELQAPWDILKQAGHDVTLCTSMGKKPLPFAISVDPQFADPVLKGLGLDPMVNPPEVCKRTKELVDGNEWNNSITYKDADMSDYDAIVLTGGPGAMLDMCNNFNVHKLIKDAIKQDKLVGALCYAVSTLVFARGDDKNSLIYGKEVSVHPASWDFYFPEADMAYELYGATTDNKGTDVHTPGFLWPIEHLVRDAVGPSGKCIARQNASRKDPQVSYDWPFVTACSVESSIAYGRKIAEVLASRKDKVTA
ncbi:MAG: DJ-1/PfpI family protein [Deltaproteobacteria bacterium]|nr:DJ-1/PfpI family protein [Deltaproteobacteria bacterium]